MKGIIKGGIFSLLLIILTSAVYAAVLMYIPIAHGISKGILWTLLGVCIFTGSLPVAKSADRYKIPKGTASALITVSVLFVIVSVLAGSVPHTGNFYAFSLIGLLCGFLGAATGS